ncbi:MAG: hypothetical protein HY875_09360 [Chloroflexi bacterium]|nr:hypothetical protein [Chloroflexota bacterium]
METKRFIGSDMARLYDRIRAQFGSGAVIIGTRTLARPGAAPLVEIIAGPAGSEGESGLALDLQWSMLGGALSRLEGERGPATVADLEELASRDPGRFAPLDGAPAAPPDWLRGFVDIEKAPAPPRSPAARRVIPTVPEPDTVVPPANDWTRAPRPMFARRDSTTMPEPPNPGGLAAALRARGFTEGAVLAVTTSAPFERDPARAVAAALAALEVSYPEEGETAVITIEGAPASGRTTALVRMALDCADSGRAAVLVAADRTRIAAREQVHSYASALGIHVEDSFEAGQLQDIARNLPPGACLFADVPAGSPAPLAGPGISHLRFVALPAHWQQNALARALANLPLSTFAGSVITFSDLAPDLAPVISTALDLRVGMAFLSSGRDVSTGVAPADPVTLASGIFAAMTGEATNGTARATA